MMLFPDAAGGPCPVCGKPIEDKHFAECQYCDRAFHLRMTEAAVDRPDCGTVFLDEEDLDTVYACTPCIEAAARAQASLLQG